MSAPQTASYVTYETQRSTFGAQERPVAMSRNFLLIVIGLLAAAIAVVGYMYYQESRSGIDIDIGEDGVTIEAN
jgi:hypothetical protein